MKVRYLAPLLLAFAAPLPAAANCAWDWLCNGEGACKHMPICDNVNEIPPARPDSQPPAMPPLSMRPHRIAGAGIGASQTLSCEHIMRKGKSGRWGIMPRLKAAGASGILVLPIEKIVP